ncbi:hypothetical protein N9U45_00220 [Acidimicrobiaceae bacterium]|nr:hypothetical protein [Acidimicrobiaceae bacterium]
MSLRISPSSVCLPSSFFENNKLSSRWNSNTPPPLGIKLIEVTLFP